MHTAKVRTSPTNWQQALTICRRQGMLSLRVTNRSQLPSSANPLQELAQKLAMQVVGASPKFLDRSAVPAEALEAESRVLREQALKSGGRLLSAT